MSRFIKVSNLIKDITSIYGENKSYDVKFLEAHIKGIIDTNIYENEKLKIYLINNLDCKIENENELMIVFFRCMFNQVDYNKFTKLNNAIKLNGFILTSQENRRERY